MDLGRGILYHKFRKIEITKHITNQIRRFRTDCDELFSDFHEMSVILYQAGLFFFRIFFFTSSGFVTSELSVTQKRTYFGITSYLYSIWISSLEPRLSSVLLERTRAGRGPLDDTRAFIKQLPTDENPEVRAQPRRHP